MAESAPSHRIAAAIALLGLAGCAHPGAKPPAATPAPIAAAPAPQATEATYSPPAHPVIRFADLAALRSLSAAELTARLGPPDFKREEQSAQIWQYRGPSCVLDVFLYPVGGDLKVAGTVTRKRSDDAGPADRCLPYGAASG